MTTINPDEMNRIAEELSELDVFVVWRDDPDQDGAEGTWYPSYSGRAMYGKECLGIVIPGEPMAFMLALGRAIAKADEDLNDQLADDLFTDVRTDSLGRDTIVYFPRVQFERNDPLTDEEREAD